MNNKTCPVCQHELAPGLTQWHFLCKECHYEKADLEPVINSGDAHTLIDEAARENGLRALRVKNFNSLLSRIKSCTKTGGSLLEVGCAHGWFLDVAKDDFDAQGIEPDQAVFNLVSQRHPTVRCGFFPDVLQEHERFDVIVFNDVIEHIPAIESIVKQCHQHLNPGGLLVLNLPSSNGVFYKLSRVLTRLSMPGSFERLWQKGLPSPHLHYFNPQNLGELIARNGFEQQDQGELPTLALDGLYKRISYTGDQGLLTRAFIYSAVALALPILKILPSDIIYSISKRKN